MSIHHYSGEIVQHLFRMVSRLNLRISLKNIAIGPDDVTYSTRLAGISIVRRSIGDGY